MKAEKKLLVVFVCLGNICRSPMAEAVLRRKAEERGLQELIEVDSCGTGDWHVGRPPHEGTLKILEGAGISSSGMRARQVGRADLEQADYIICMDENNERDVLELVRSGSIQPTGRVMRFMELLPERNIAGVPDPYYTGDFDETYELVSEGSERLLDLIQRDKLQ